jgi:hypothetical protein
MSSYSDILKEALEIAEQRQGTYGEPTVNFTRIKECAKTMFGLELSLVEIAQLMVATKLARQIEKPKHDNIVDAINYFAIMLHFIENEKPDVR